MRSIYTLIYLIFTMSSYLSTGMAQFSVVTEKYQTAEHTYRLLLSQVNIHREMKTFDSAKESLINEAEQYAKSGEYEIANIYLEEILFILNQAGPSIDVGAEVTQHPVLHFSLMSGLDFNKQEFEIGYLESDSTIIEEINKPYVGVQLDYTIPTSSGSAFELSNALRYDKENWRNDYRIGWRNQHTLSFFYNGYWNDSDELFSNSFWEHELETRVGSGRIGAFNWSIRNNYTIKTYRESSSFISDFYRNRFDIYAEWQIGTDYLINVEMGHELNETLGRADNDYAQGTLRSSLRRSGYQFFNYYISPELHLRDYQLEFSDSTISNRYLQLGMEVLLEVPIIQKIRFELTDDIFLKRYDVKSTLEPDYVWNFIKGEILFDLISDFEIGFGYEWEIKRHDQQPEYDTDITEQDYQAHGISTVLNYFSLSGTYFSSTVSYQWRRYPSSITNDLFSIYSDRNIFSITLLAYAPITNHLSLNGFVTYDNDVDKDLDQQNNQSTIFTLELGYKF